jgi:4,5-dihydroxyphthalate decarboxylase
MSDKSLDLTFGGIDYLDRTHALATGQIKPEGIELDWQVDRIGEIFRRMSQDAEFHASELSLSTYMIMRARGDDRFVGIPVFPARAFRQRHIYVGTNSGIETPQDLVGRTVGVIEYQITAALWIRAFLEHDYGVRPGDLRWRQGGHDEPHWRPRLEHDLPADVELEQIPADKSLVGMLEAGELDALATTFPPAPFRAGSPAIRRLFPDYRPVELDYFHRTGFFPIMHLVVVRRDVHEEHPWVARSLYDAFVAAKEAGRRRLRHLDELAVSDPFWEERLVEIETVFGGDAFPYGYGANEATVEAMTRYSYEQGLAARKLDPAELFAPEFLTT